MIRIFLGKRFVRSIKKLEPVAVAQAEQALASVLTAFGNPHSHSGLGVRKLSHGLWECRVDLRWRILLIDDGGRLLAYDVMTHDELRAWLKRQ